MSLATLRVADGADLMTRLSSDEVGLASFIVKRDWRTELDRLVRREGDQLFAPDTSAVGIQPYPNYPDVDEGISLIFTARKDNGKTALIVGTTTTLYRYFAFEDQLIVEDGIVEDGILGTISDGTWLVIGSGFSTNGHKWEAHNVSGVAVFNNGANLPVSYDLNEFAVRPIYELREQGVAFVGTIMEVAGVLLCMDVAYIHEDYLATVMTAVGYGMFSSGQESHFDRVHYETIWSDPKGPGRWGATVPAAIAVGSRILVVAYDLASVAPGDELRITGAGADGGDLVTTLGYKAGSTTWILTDPAETNVTTATVGKSDAAALLTGSYPLADDSSPILRGVKTQDDQIVIAKATGFILGQYTGNASSPFSFVRIYTGDGALFWRWTLIDVGGMLVYAGESEFYVFDLVSRRPQVHARLALCSDGFFTAVAVAGQDQVFAADNTFTHDVWFIFPGVTDKVLAYDYRPRAIGGDRCSTIGSPYSAAAMVEIPSSVVAHGAAEQWFVLGTSAGALLQYGKTRTGSFLWTRRGATYTSELQAGESDFGDVFNEKHVEAYALILSSASPKNAVEVGIYTETIPGKALTLQIGVTLGAPKHKNTIPVHHQSHLFQDRIIVRGAGNVEFTKRVWSVSAQGGGGIARI